MKTLLVPVDFSASSNNAVAYAVDLSNDLELNEVVLIANLYVPLFEQIIPTPDLIQVSAEDIQSRKKMLMQQFEELKLQLLKKLDPDIIVRIVISEFPLVRSVLEQVVKADPCLVIIGSNSYDITEDSIIGRQIIELTKVIPVPVLIVPPKSSYRPITEALVACELKSLVNIDSLQRLENISLWRHPKLLLLNVDGTHRNNLPGEPSPETKEILSHQLKDFDYQLYNLEDRDILQGVLRFADDKKVQLIVALPGKHSFLYNLTHQNILHGILANSLKPVLILKEKTGRTRQIK